jgi:hypothetical protein
VVAVRRWGCRHPWLICIIWCPWWWWNLRGCGECAGCDAVREADGRELLEACADQPVAGHVGFLIFSSESVQPQRCEELPVLLRTDEDDSCVEPAVGYRGGRDQGPPVGARCGGEREGVRVEREEAGAGAVRERGGSDRGAGVQACEPSAEQHNPAGIFEAGFCVGVFYERR